MFEGWQSLLVFIAANFLAASSGAIFKPDAWYDALNKPSWQPPKWLFAPVWSLLYLMIAVAGWLVWRSAGFEGSQAAFIVYAVQLVLNAGWSGFFFGLRRPDLALVECVFLWAAVVANTALFFALVPLAGWLMVPYVVWVSFAMFLNWTICRLNPRTQTA